MGDDHLTASELAQLRGPFVSRPMENASPREWVRWADEVLAAVPDAQRIRSAADAKASRAAGKGDSK